jgi:hypothetical protein
VDASRGGWREGADDVTLVEGKTGVTDGSVITRSAAPSVAAVCDGDPAVGALIDQHLRVAVAGLPEMFLPDQRTFAFTRRGGRDATARDGLALSGQSMRYGAITLLGLRLLPESVQRTILHGDTASSFCGSLIDGIQGMTNLGDVAILAWAAAELRHPDLPEALARLAAIDDGSPCETVHAAWTVSALTAACKQADTAATAHTAAQRLLASYSTRSRIFPHGTDPSTLRRGRGHIACFADQVYPIQALARYGDTFRRDEAIEAANGCAAQICKVMGRAGQWWWHYDARTGDVVEGYPVYSVHQDAMAPMALLDLQEAGGDAHADAVRLGLSWMVEAPEIGRSLLDESLGVIWRKVGRTDARKLVRASRAVLSRMHPRLRFRALDTVYQAKRVDYECRPYHLGWILYAWLRGAGR